MQEINVILTDKNRAVIAIAGLPGSEKAYMVKRFVRLVSETSAGKIFW